MVRNARKRCLTECREEFRALVLRIRENALEGTEHEKNARTPCNGRRHTADQNANQARAQRYLMMTESGKSTLMLMSLSSLVCAGGGVCV